MHIVSKALPLLLFFTTIFCAIGQEVSDFTELHYTSDNGLPQNSVMLMQMDKNGFVWMTTQGGLARFDGTRFTTYNLSNVPRLASNRIIDLGLTDDSTVYFKDNGFKVFSFDENNRPYILNPHIRNRFVVLHSKEKQSDLVRNLLPADRRRVESLFAHYATAVLYTQVGTEGDGFLRVGDNDLFYLYQKKIVFQKVFGYYPSIAYDNSGVLNGRFYLIDRQRQISCVDSSGREYPVSLKVDGQRELVPDGHSQLFQQGKRLFLHHLNTFYELEPAPGNVLRGKAVLKTRDIGKVYCYLNIPGSGVQMVGTATGGLYVFKKKQFKTVQIPGTSNNFYTQHLYQKNALLTGLGIISPSGTVTGKPFPLMAQGGILVDKQGYVWINPQGKKIEKRAADFKLIRQFHADREIGRFTHTPDGTLWFNLSAGSLGKITGDSIQWIRQPKEVKSFIPISDSAFWISDGRGLYRLDIRTSALQELRQMRGKEVREFYFDRRKTLWIGTYGQGFYAIRNGRVKALPPDRNGHLLAVHTFLEDRKGFMWMSTNHGLFKCKVTDLYDYLDGKSADIYYYYYDKSNGFANNEFNGGCHPSSVVFPDGKFSFPSMDGLVQVYPDSVTDILPSSKILIDKFAVDGKEKPFTTGFQLEPSFNRIEILLASPYFGLPENQLLEYNIKGLDNEWYELNNNLTITLNRLEYGSYTLQVRKKSGFGQHMNVLTKRFTVMPFWYQTWYFTLFVLVLLIFSFYLVVKLRYHYLTLRKKQLEAQVRERTMQLEYSNRLKEKITLLLAHDLQSPLHFLNLLSDHVTASLEKDRLDDVRTGTAEIKKAATSIHAFVKEINLWTKSQQEGFFLSKRPFAFGELAGELKDFFGEMLLLKNNTLEIVNPGQWHVYTNREVLKAVVRNLIDNSNKYTTGGHIVLELEENGENQLRLSVTDNGRGMSPADLSKIKRRIENVLTTAGIEQSGRLGYQIIIDFVARLDCRLEVESVVGEGTKVTISGLLPGQPDKPEAFMADSAPPNITTL
ncbi:hypothetical protein GCM10010967_54820 [Dyadobacter beijingensis]|uniref:Histidine kinase domain-containing protein n=2 Tax=Dyadobacter beijingensis TaxID=365489 RepID=A0ABQ2IHV4_9BACT|nr:hypothetical protein GCM10010967_54820 [Dyadobacter beijingensis]